MRNDNRQNNELRPLNLIPHFTRQAEGSVLMEMGRTRVICTATVEEKVPSWMKGKGEGWVTAEYAMLPRATESRTQREITKGKPNGRSQEIQRLIGRSLRSIMDMKALGERTIWIDCDVIEADGGTRTASINGGFAALSIAIDGLLEKGLITENPIREAVAAVSVGLHEDEAILDLCYVEDSAAQVDMNVVMTESGRFVEIQGTGEDRPFTPEEMAEMLALAKKGTGEIMTFIREELKK